MRYVFVCCYRFIETNPSSRLLTSISSNITGNVFRRIHRCYVMKRAPFTQISVNINNQPLSPIEDRRRTKYLVIIENWNGCCLKRASSLLLNIFDDGTHMSSVWDTWWAKAAAASNISAVTAQQIERRIDKPTRYGPKNMGVIELWKSNWFKWRKRKL